MIAIYYVEESSPYHMCTVDVTDASTEAFLAAIKKDECPMPSSDIVFIENDEVVDQFRL